MDESQSPLSVHVVYLRSGPLLLVRRPTVEWRDLQDEWEDDFMTSLGPYGEEDVTDFFEQQFGAESRWPLTRAQVTAFFADADARELSSG